VTTLSEPTEPTIDLARHDLGVRRARGDQRSAWTGRVAAVARVSLGWIFLWAFLDKLFGLGHETASGKAWIDGVSPTNGFLSKGATGPFEGVAHSIAGQGWADVLFMLGLAGVGTALCLGVAMRAAAAAASQMIVLMWAAVLPPENNPFLDDHLVYVALLGLLVCVGAGRTWGLGRRWDALPLVQRYPFLR
jgi:thiosulfate dehydrogenase [quinone] large subunit